MNKFTIMSFFLELCNYVMAENYFKMTNYKFLIRIIINIMNKLLF